jgi:hypothetical protein
MTKKVEKRDLSANDFKDIELYANELYKYHDSLENRQAELDRLIEKFKNKIGFECEPIFVNVYKSMGEGFFVSDYVYNDLQKAFEGRDDLSSYLYTAKLVPMQFEPYQPAHDEICTVLTTEGLATKCKAYHHNGAIYAIALKNDKPDGTFAPEQIAKFLKL